MSFVQLTFPLTVDFGCSKYWIGETDSHKYGEAVTAFLSGENFAQEDSEADSLRRELEVYLKMFGSIIQPYPKRTQVSKEMFDQLKQSSAECSVNYAHHAERGRVYLLERYTFPALRDFLYVELGKSILKGTTHRGSAACVTAGFCTSMGSGPFIVNALPPGKRSRPAGRWERGQSLRKRSRMRMPGNSTSGLTKNTMPA